MERRADRAGRYLFYVIYLVFILDRLFLTLTRIPDLLGEQTVSLLSDGMTVLFMALAAFRLLFLKKQTVRILVISLIILAVFSVSAVVSKSKTMLYTVLIALCASREDFDRDIRFSLRCVIAITLATLLLCGTGLIENYTKERDLYEATRNAFGFSHPNVLALIIFLTVAEFLYLRRDKRQPWKYVVAIGLSAAGFLVTHSFTGGALTLLLVGTALIIEWKEKNRRISRRWMKALVILFILTVVLIMIYYWNNPDRMMSVLKTVRSRIRLAQKYIDAYGISLFGNAIEVGADVSIPGYRNTYGFLDSGFARILVEFGVLTLIVFFGVYFLSVFREIRRRNNLLAAFGIIYLLYGLVEYKALTFVFNPFLIVYISSCFEKRRSTGPKTI